MRRRANAPRRTHARRPCRARGFTLVEVLLALMIGSLVVVSVVSAARALSSARTGVEQRVARSASARRAMAAIVAGLRNVRRDPVQGKPVIVGHSGGRDAGNDGIDLLVISDRQVRRDAAESDQYEMSFYLARPSGQRYAVLMCRKDHGFDEHPDDGGIATVVADGIVGLSFEYHSGDEWVDQWSVVEPRAPKAVRVTVVAVGPDLDDSPTMPEPLVLSTIVPLGVNKPIEQQLHEESGQPPAGGPKR